MGCAEPVQSFPCRQTPGAQSHDGNRVSKGVFCLAPADDRGGAGYYRAGLVSLRHRTESAITRGIAAIHARAGTDVAAAADRGPVRAEHVTGYPAQRGATRLGP